MSAARKLWGAPAAIAVVSASGLVAGLLGDGIWDWIASGALALPLAVAAWCVCRPATPRRR